MIGVLISGGIKSAVLMDIAAKRKSQVCGIYVNWGQKGHCYEDTAAQMICNYYDVKRQIIIANSLMKTHQGIGTGYMHTGEMQFRRGINITFLSLACISSPAIEQIWIGHNKSATNDFTNSPDFYNRADALFSLYDVQISAPLIHMSDQHIKNFAEKMDIPAQLAWVCKDENKPCGKCQSCVACDPRRKKHRYG